MARQRSEFLGSLGKLFAIFKKVVDKVLELGGSDEDIVRLDTDVALVEAVARLIIMEKRLAMKEAQEKIQRGEQIHEGAEEQFLMAIFGRGAVERLTSHPLSPEERDSLREKIKAVLQTLTYREREIVRLRYGLGDGYTYTLEEAGRIFKVTRARVRLIEARAVRKLMDPVRARHLAGFIGNLQQDAEAQQP